MRHYCVTVCIHRITHLMCKSALPGGSLEYGVFFKWCWSITFSAWERASQGLYRALAGIFKCRVLAIKYQTLALVLLAAVMSLYGSVTVVSVGTEGSNYLGSKLEVAGQGIHHGLSQEIWLLPSKTDSHVYFWVSFSHCSIGTSQFKICNYKPK